MPNDLGKIRRSSIITTAGPGAVIDFRAGGGEGAPVSAVVAGLEEWDRRAPPEGLRNEQTVYEERLQKKLGVKGFRLPPVDPDDDNAWGPHLLGVRFPVWLQCPNCNVLRRASDWNRDPGDVALYCGACTFHEPGQRKIRVVPVRFITACHNGHLDEFPWDFWVRHRPECRKSGQLILKAEHAGLAGLILSCTECGARRSMDGSFSRDALKGFYCNGRMPWLGVPPVKCDETPRVLQRGASNLYFPVLHSALSIPPWSDGLQKLLGQYWDPICSCDAEHRAPFISMLQGVLGNVGMRPEELASAIATRVERIEQTDTENLRWDEWLQFIEGGVVPPETDDEFEIRYENLPDRLKPYFGHLIRVVRLREVRAISAFTRILPPSDGDAGGPPVKAPIKAGPLDWLPAVEIRGEGIFVALNQAALADWEQRDAVMQRAARADDAYRQDWALRAGPDKPPPRVITPRMLLLHSLAHVLMRQLSLNCGYSSASLRERLYVATDDKPMAGVLIYTGTPDADGTLGGLARQGVASTFEPLLSEALASIHWCSSDPLCIEGMMSISEACNLAACHSCLLAPETSCEEFNRFLDRAMLTGTPEDRGIGFFHGYPAGG